MLEILASVQNCADKTFAALEHLVFEHISVVSGCICVLQQWDDSRRNFIKKLRALSVPVMVLLIVRPGDPKPDPETLREEPENFHVLETGKISEGLSKLK